MKELNFNYNGYSAIVLLPDNFNGKWIWKTEFFHAFDKAEQELFDRGYARVYYEISNMYGSYRAVRLMHNFHLHLQKEYGLKEKPILFGFSRGGLYAFNYALFYPEYISKMYLDAPVMNLRSWPPAGSHEYDEMLKEYCLDAEQLKLFNENPKDNIKEFASRNIPLLLLAGDSDTIVPLCDNAQYLIDYYKRENIAFEYYIKKGCGHHPHSLDDVTPIIEFCEHR